MHDYTTTNNVSKGFHKNLIESKDESAQAVNVVKSSTETKSGHERQIITHNSVTNLTRATSDTHPGGNNDEYVYQYLMFW